MIVGTLIASASVSDSQILGYSVGARNAIAYTQPESRCAYYNFSGSLLR